MSERFWDGVIRRRESEGLWEALILRCREPSKEGGSLVESESVQEDESWRGSEFGREFISAERRESVRRSSVGY